MITAGQPEARTRKRIGRYTVTGRIGRGGMGMVYRGYDEVLEREIALKTLTLEGNLDEESRQRFEVEAKAAAKLQHPNIVTVFELGEERGIPFIAMELLPGVDLETLLRSGETLLLEEKLEIVVQVCRGLTYAHEHRVIHRDIKPSNIRLLDEGTVKIMDFGIAKLGGTNLTKSGMMVGTVHYMSPEQIRGTPLDGRSDVFSVGVILYELLAGRRPFLGEAATQVLFNIVNEPTPAVTGDLGLPGARLQEVLSRALAKEREERYPTAAHLADDLTDILTAQTRQRAISPDDNQLEQVTAARRLLKEGHAEESHRRLREILRSNPHLLEARRALRTVRREMVRRPEPETEDYPELEATFQAAPTRRSTGTEVLQPTVLQSSEPAPRALKGGSAWIVAGLGLFTLFALGAGILLIRGAASGPQKVPVRAEQPVPVAQSPAAVVATVALAVVTEPAGAAVSVDGRRTPGITPLQLRLDSGVEHVLSVSLEGHRSQEARVSPGRFPTELKISLEPAGPLGQVVLSSSYPVDVLWRGKVMAKAQASPRFALPVGRQTLTVTAPGYFMRANLNVDVRGNGETTADVPRLGRLSIRANPDNCRVFIDGTFVDYPPIVDKPVAAGSHTVTFRWQDGVHKDETAQVVAGAPAFVTGRRD